MIPSFVERPYNLKLNVALKRKRDKTAFITAQRVFISSRLNYMIFYQIPWKVLYLLRNSKPILILGQLKTILKNYIRNTLGEFVRVGFI